MAAMASAALRVSIAARRSDVLLSERPGHGDAVDGSGAVHRRPHDSIDVGEADRGRPLALDEHLRGANGAAKGENRPLLVQVELGEPPETVTAVGEALAERAPVDADVPQRLDPRVGVCGRLLVAGGIQVVSEADAAMSVAGVDFEECVERHQSPRAIASSAAR